MVIEELSRIDRTIEIQASPERVWRALTDASELSAWFMVSIEGQVAEGGSAWMTSVHPEHRGARFEVWFVEFTRPHRIVWQWHPGEIDPAVDYGRERKTTVTFTLEPSGSGTRLSVSETGFDQISLARRAKVYGENSQGWAEVLVWLQRHVEAAR
jgi:uncharacterized protein YndB with AHSA1/START domain